MRRLILTLIVWPISLAASPCLEQIEELVVDGREQPRFIYPSFQALSPELTSKIVETLQLPAGQRDPQMEASLRYSIEAGGKRLRPFLIFLFADLYNIPPQDVFEIAAAAEILHNESLILDDINDGDETRRGRPAHHKAFGIDISLNVATVLNNRAYQLILDRYEPTVASGILKQWTRILGPTGMPRGQILDIKTRNQKLSLDEKNEISFLKTGLGFYAGIVAVQIYANASPRDLQAARDFAYYLGILFQAKDDWLASIKSSAELGKPAESDTRNGTITYPQILGDFRATDDYIQEIATRAFEALRQLPGHHQQLKLLIEAIRSQR